MPELPEVETIKEALKKSVEGATITETKVYNRRFRIEVQPDFEQTITGSRIIRIYRRAKYALLELDNGYTVIWHFGMSGKVKIADMLPDLLDKHDHIVISTTQGYLIFNDARRFGLMVYARTASLSEHPLFFHTGIDPFDAALDADYLLAQLKGKKTPIKIALLDQSIINGIGNIYASEALYEARLSPLRESSSLSHTEAARLIKAIQTTLEKAIAAGGSTLRDYRKPDGSMGYFQHQHCVYGKEGQRCPNCTCNADRTGGIAKLVQGGRSTFYCPHLQK